MCDRPRHETTDPSRPPMASNRVDIPDDLAARVMFASDRTCCVCRLPGKTTQIHHIDEDPSNNKIENLAVLCFDCHGAAHTKPAFGRSLNSLQIKLYNESWRELVSGRLLPEAAGPLREYAAEAVSLVLTVVHVWINAYMSVMTFDLGKSIWESVRDVKVEYGEQIYKRCEFLFEGTIGQMDRMWVDAVSCYGEVMPVEVKLALIRCRNSLNNLRWHYRWLPTGSHTDEERTTAFRTLFVDTANVLEQFGDSVASVIKQVQTGRC